MTIIRDIYNKIPECGFTSPKADDAVKWVGKHISTPENRLIIGISALASQPFIDLYNKEVDEQTRKISCARTTAKIIAGIITGVSIRYGCIKLTNNFTHIGEIGEKINKNGKEITITKIKKFFTPSIAKLEDYDYKRYQHTIGMGLAVVGLLFTNFLIDMPLTNYLTNLLTNKFVKTPTASKKDNGGAK